MVRSRPASRLLSIKLRLEVLHVGLRDGLTMEVAWTRRALAIAFLVAGSLDCAHRCR